MTKRICVLVAVLTAMMVIPALGQDATVDLRPIWKKGQTSRYKIIQAQTTSNQINGNDKALEMKVEHEAQITWEVTEPNEQGGGVAKMTIDKLKMKLTGPDGTAIEASDQGGDDERTQKLADRLKAMTGIPLEITVSADGHIEKVDGADVIRNQAGEGADDLDEDYFKEIAIDTAAIVGGTKGIKPGDTWENQHKSKNEIGKVTYDTTYKLAGVEKIADIPVALVNTTSKLTVEPNIPEMPENGPQIDIQVNINEATSSRQMMFDLSRHEIVGGCGKQVLDAEMRMSIAEHENVSTMRQVTTMRWIRLSEK